MTIHQNGMDNAITAKIIGSTLSLNFTTVHAFATQ
jgi:hypothetical protein